MEQKFITDLMNHLKVKLLPLNLKGEKDYLLKLIFASELQQGFIRYDHLDSDTIINTYLDEAQIYLIEASKAYKGIFDFYCSMVCRNIPALSKDTTYLDITLCLNFVKLKMNLDKKDIEFTAALFGRSLDQEVNKSATYQSYQPTSINWHIFDAPDYLEEAYCFFDDFYTETKFPVPRHVIYPHHDKEQGFPINYIKKSS